MLKGGHKGGPKSNEAGVLTEEEIWTQKQREDNVETEEKSAIHQSRPFAWRDASLTAHKEGTSSANQLRFLASKTVRKSVSVV